MVDPVDDYAVQQLKEIDGKEFRSVIKKAWTLTMKTRRSWRN